MNRQAVERMENEYIRFLFIAAKLLLHASSCGKIEQAKNMIDMVSTISDFQLRRNLEILLLNFMF